MSPTTILPLLSCLPDVPHPESNAALVVASEKITAGSTVVVLYYQIPLQNKFKPADTEDCLFDLVSIGEKVKQKKLLQAKIIRYLNPVIEPADQHSTTLE